MLIYRRSDRWSSEIRRHFVYYEVVIFVLVSIILFAHSDIGAALNFITRIIAFLRVRICCYAIRVYRASAFSSIRWWNSESNKNSFQRFPLPGALAFVRNVFRFSLKILTCTRTFSHCQLRLHTSPRKQCEWRSILPVTERQHLPSCGYMYKYGNVRIIIKIWGGQIFIRGKTLKFKLKKNLHNFLYIFISFVEMLVLKRQKKMFKNENAGTIKIMR